MKKKQKRQQKRDLVRERVNYTLVSKERHIYCEICGKNIKFRYQSDIEKHEKNNNHQRRKRFNQIRGKHE